MSIVGSSNLIGNPTKLLSTLGTGIRDFYEAPIERYTRGGLQEGGLGLYVGTRSLVTNTVVGTTGSIGNFTNAVSGGILALTGDNKFI
jgi:hypothetical protein